MMESSSTFLGCLVKGLLIKDRHEEQRQRGRDNGQGIGNEEN